MSDFVKADIGKLEGFVSQSEEAIKEFGDIRTEFERINSTLLDNWDGLGKASYKSVSDHILEKVGGIQDVLNTINDTVVKPRNRRIRLGRGNCSEQRRRAHAGACSR